MTTLYEVSDTYLKALSDLVEQEDLDDDIVADTLESIEGEFTEKGLSVAAYIFDINAKATALKDAEARIKKRRLAQENKAARLEQYLKDNMLSLIHI